MHRGQGVVEYDNRGFKGFDVVPQHLHPALAQKSAGVDAVDVQKLYVGDDQTDATGQMIQLFCQTFGLLHIPVQIPNYGLNQNGALRLQGGL